MPAPYHCLALAFEDTWWWRAARLIETGNHEATLELLGRTLEAGELWRTQPLKGRWFDPLRDDPRFRALEAEATRRAAALGTKPQLHVFPPPRSDRRTRLLLALHGATSSAAALWPHWLPATELGYLLAVPQSSQPASADAFCWDDVELAERELAGHARTLARDHDFDPDSVVLAGYSQGAALAFRLAQRAIPFDARRFLLAAPSLFDPPIDHARAPLLKGAVIRGDQDPYGERFPAFEESCRSAGLALEVDLAPGLGHAYPPDFAAKLTRLLGHLAEPGL